MQQQSTKSSGKVLLVSLAGMVLFYTMIAFVIAPWAEAKDAQMRGPQPSPTTAQPLDVVISNAVVTPQGGSRVQDVVMGKDSLTVRYEAQQMTDSLSTRAAALADARSILMAVRTDPSPIPPKVITEAVLPDTPAGAKADLRVVFDGRAAEKVGPITGDADEIEASIVDLTTSTQLQGAAKPKPAGRR